MELANPLGSKKGKHKLGVFWWSLLNLRPEYRSSLRSIQLIGVVGAQLLKNRGVEAFLQPFVKDLERLMNGVELQVC